MRLKPGEIGERQAEQWFLNNGWHMTRTQPPVTILGIVTPSMIAVIKRFIPRLAAFGYMVIARMGKGGVADYTGYEVEEQSQTYGPQPVYRACEVKEASGNSMPCSRLDKAQREFMDLLPEGCAWVGVFWADTGKFTMHPYQSKGSYKRP